MVVVRRQENMEWIFLIDNIAHFLFSFVPLMGIGVRKKEPGQWLAMIIQAVVNLLGAW